MTNDPLPIIEEYLRVQGNDAAVRRNAVVALAVVGSEASVKRLVNVAQNDEDATVRDRAEAEIAQLPIESRTRAWGIVDSALRAKGTRAPAYALLGRLRCRGVDPVPDQGRLSFRLRNTIRSTALDRPGNRWRPRILPIISASIVGFVGAVLALVVFGLLTGEDVPPEQALWLLFGGPFLIALLSVVVAQRLNPILLHCDRMVGGFVEIAWTGLAILAMTAFVPLVVYGFGSRPFGPIGWLLLLAIFATAGMAARAGSMLGALGFATQRGRFLGSMMGGLTLAAAASTGVALVGHLISLDGPLEGWMDTSWVLSIPVSWGLSGMFALTDFKPATVNRVSSPGARRATLALGGVAALALVMLTGPVEHAERKPDRLDIHRRQQRTFDAVPYELAFELGERPLRLVATAPDRGLERTDDLTMELLLGSKSIAKVDDPPTIARDLDRGEYRLKVGLAGGAGETKDLFVMVVNRVAPWIQGVGQHHALAKPASLTIEFQEVTPHLTPAGWVTIGTRVRVDVPEGYSDPTANAEEIASLDDKDLTVSWLGAPQFGAREVAATALLEWVSAVERLGVWYTPQAAPVQTSGGQIEVGSTVRLDRPSTLPAKARAAAPPMTVGAIVTDGKRTFFFAKENGLLWSTGLVREVRPPLPAEE